MCSNEKKCAESRLLKGSGVRFFLQLSCISCVLWGWRWISLKTYKLCNDKDWQGYLSSYFLNIRHKPPVPCKTLPINSFNGPYGHIISKFLPVKLSMQGFPLSCHQYVFDACMCFIIIMCNSCCKISPERHIILMIY